MAVIRGAEADEGETGDNTSAFDEAERWACVFESSECDESRWY